MHITKGKLGVNNNSKIQTKHLTIALHMTVYKSIDAHWAKLSVFT